MKAKAVNIHEWRKRRADLTNVEFDEAMRLYDLRLQMIEECGSMTKAEWTRYKELHPCHVVELVTGADNRYTLAFTMPTMTDYCPHVWRSRPAAQKVADWLCTSTRAIFKPQPVSPPRGPIERYSTASTLPDWPNIVKKQAE